MNRLGSKYIQVVPYFGPASKGNLLTSLRLSLLTSGLLKKVVERPDGSETGSDYVFDADYIARLYGVYKNETTADYVKADLHVLFTLTGETPEQLANVTWKDYQKALQLLFQIEDASIQKHKRPNTRSTAVNMKQWYDPLVTPPVEHERANEMIERRMRELQRSPGNQTWSANRARSSSAGLTRSNTPKKAPGRSFANLAANYNNTPKPKSMENELKEAFGLGGGRRLTKRQLRKNASRKKKASSRR
jgi:hypothetical protein